MRMMMAKRLPIHIEGDEEKPKAKRGRKRKVQPAEDLSIISSPSSMIATAATPDCKLLKSSLLDAEDSTQGYSSHSSDTDNTQPLSYESKSSTRAADEPSKKMDAGLRTFSGIFKCEQVWVPTSLLQNSSVFGACVGLTPLPSAFEALAQSRRPESASGKDRSVDPASPIFHLQSMVDRAHRQEIRLNTLASLCTSNQLQQAVNPSPATLVEPSPSSSSSSASNFSVGRPGES